MIKIKSFVWKNLHAGFIAWFCLILNGCTSQPDPSADAGVPVPETTVEPAKKPQALSASNRPNVVIVITDDQGYGDLGSTGNPIIQTPMLDTLANESVCLTDYHVAPTCSPTRAALMSGHWTNRTGAWHTIMGRSMLREDEGTLGQFFQDAGYRTGMFGKWHLGDNFPYRPEDRGFEEVYRHGGGGVGQTPDVWDNSYFDGGYFHNGEIVEAKGFCTDVFFEQANRFITQSAKSGKPFLAYISTNAPHGPFHCPQKYMDLYEGESPTIQAFYGMITNIDENVGKTRDLLKDLGIYKNTIFIFTTDNGTARGREIFNAGMRGQKGSEYDGGHRVPFMLHWPDGGMAEKRTMETLCHAIDIAPTLLDLIGAPMPKDYSFDGISIKSLLQGKGDQDWPDRMLVTDSQRVRDPVKWKQSAVMTQGWRLVNGKELYQIDSDPGQEKDVAGEHPERLQKMRAFYEAWWAELEPSFARTTELYVGHAEHPVVSLTSHDWIQEEYPPWNQAQNRHKLPVHPRKLNMKHAGHWAIKAVREGRYEVEVRRWPKESGRKINEVLLPGASVPGADQAFRARPGLGIGATSATIRLNGEDLESKPVDENSESVTFEIELSQGKHQLSPYFTIPQGELGCYYAIVKGPM
ncbi:MAG: arylsulfatase [Verrucomicrobia bacterium]|nr:arylsulfatase [Verrucomicrobiota bacterium]